MQILLTTHNDYGSKEETLEEENENYLMLFPNPSGDYVIAYYDISEFDQKGKITIFDLNGRFLKSLVVYPDENQKVLDLNSLPNGLYIFTLAIDNKILDSEKLSKGRY